MAREAATDSARNVSRSSSGCGRGFESASSAAGVPGGRPGSEVVDMIEVRDSAFAR